MLIILFIFQWISIPFALTNSAVSNIADDSGKRWTGEWSTKFVGVWIDYALLLVNLLSLHR